MRQCAKINRGKNQQKTLKFDEWKDQMPQWLKEAYTAVENGQLQEAARLLDEKTVQIAMEDMSATSRTFTMFGMAVLLKQIGQVKRAEGLYEEILKTNNHSAVYNDLADIYRNTGRLNKAIRYLKTAIDKDPNEPILWGNLGSNLMQLGQIDKAIELMRKVTQRLPDNNFAHSNMLLYMHYLPDLPRPAIFEEAKKWAQRNLPQRLAKTTHRNIPDPERKLKIGYISPDFRNHSVTYFFEPLLDAHNRDIVEVYGYGNIHHYDNTTTRLKSKFDHYRNIRPLDDKAVVELIENDGIDILVDLAGHSANSRIYAMAYKPAPIQATWLGYPDTTGMSQIDYRITDSIADPPCDEKYYSEKLFYLPDIFLCFGPGNTMPAVAPLPFFDRKHITFGCFNNSSKINPFITGLWSNILKQTPNSKLLLKFKSGQDDEIREVFIKRFEAVGISNDRIAVSGWLPSPADLELYNQVDIALDTSPYGGTTTTCQSLLMGVPVISLIGEHHMSRVGLSILTNLGLEFFAAPTPEQYVSKAVALASNPSALGKIRAAMRARMAASPLCNSTKFAEKMENAYRQMWHKWCLSQGNNNLVEVESSAEKV